MVINFDMQQKSFVIMIKLKEMQIAIQYEYMKYRMAKLITEKKKIELSSLWHKS